LPSPVRHKVSGIYLCPLTSHLQASALPPSHLKFQPSSLRSLNLKSPTPQPSGLSYLKSLINPLTMPRIILALLISLLSQQVLNADAIDRAWQTSIEPVTLSLRNKLADAPYTVQFIVEAQSSDAQWSYTTESAANAWQRPQFPKDFKGPNVDHLRPQAYTWHARVVSDDNQRVMDGSFTYPNITPSEHD